MAIKQARQLSYTVIFEPAEEGGYVVIAPAFDGAITQGETLEDARAMAKEALAALVESCLPHTYSSAAMVTHLPCHSHRMIVTDYVHHIRSTGTPLRWQRQRPLRS